MTVIDSIEDGIASIESDGKIIRIDAAQLPEDASEGDIIVKTEKGWRRDTEALKRRRERLIKKMKRLRKND